MAMVVLKKQDFVHTNYRERPQEQYFHRPEDIEKFRVQPQFAKSVADIMNRFVLGVTDYNKFNGNPDIAVGTSDMDITVRDTLLNNPFDPMGANVIDRVDYEEMRVAASEALTSFNRKNVAGSNKVSETPQESVIE